MKKYYHNHSDNYARKVWENVKLGLLLVPILWLIAWACQAQSGKPVTAEEIRNNRVGNDRLIWGYEPISTPGWKIQQGDTLYFGKGSLPNKDFAFIYESLNLTTVYRNGNPVKEYLLSDYAGKRGVVKELSQNGTKRQGFTMCAIVGVGMPVRYYVELDNAIEAGEILPPKQFRKPVASGNTVSSSSLADELKKLKDLFDSGALTQEEFDTAKKKLLGN